MASTYTTRLRLEKQATGENANTWGDKTNVNFDLIDEAIYGYASKSVAGSSNVTLTNSNATADESRQSIRIYWNTNWKYKCFTSNCRIKIMLYLITRQVVTH
jgi:hypothetical protein